MYLAVIKLTQLLVQVCVCVCVCPFAHLCRYSCIRYECAVLVSSTHMYMYSPIQASIQSTYDCDTVYIFSVAVGFHLRASNNTSHFIFITFCHAYNACFPHTYGMINRTFLGSTITHVYIIICTCVCTNS